LEGDTSVSSFITRLDTQKPRESALGLYRIAASKQGTCTYVSAFHTQKEHTNVANTETPKTAAMAPAGYATPPSIQYMERGYGTAEQTKQRGKTPNTAKQTHPQHPILRHLHLSGISIVQINSSHL